MSYVNLTDEQIEQMAAWALSSYEMTGDWRAAHRAAAEYSIDELGGRARPSAVKLAVKLARLGWQARSLRTRRAIEDHGDFDDMGRRGYEAGYHYAQKRQQGRF
jgi:hypothetical protein